jgi:two-component system nitrogen regulation response regulator GlnG
VVEDESAIRRLIVVVLRDLGLETISAPDAETALGMLETASPDLIITDVRLPGMDGVEFTRRVKSDGERKTPVLLTSAYGEPRGHQGDGFLPKPFDVDTLAEAVASFVG